MSPPRAIAHSARAHRAAAQPLPRFSRILTGTTYKAILVAFSDSRLSYPYTLSPALSCRSQTVIPIHAPFRIP